MHPRRLITEFCLLVALCICQPVALAGDEAAKSGPADPALQVPSIVVQLLRSESVARELQLDRQQQEECSTLAEKLASPLFLVRDLPEEAKREQISPLREEIEQTLNSRLTAAQRARLSEIVLRAQGWPGLLAQPHVATLQLSEQQLDEMSRLLAATQNKPEGASSNSLDARMYKLLNAEQQSRLAELAGRPFDLSQVRKIACRAPELRDVADWINSPPLTLAGLRGQVVALHFFAFGCINCIHNQPHYKDWHARYSNSKFVLLALHTPETEQERDVAKLRADIAAREIEYPVAVDAKGSNWRAWANRLWPSTYLIDKQGYVRDWWYGELNWEGAKGEQYMRERIGELLAEPATAIR